MLETLYLNSRGQVTIPSKMRTALHLKDGSALVAVKMTNKIVMNTTYTSDNEDIMNLYNSVKVSKGKTTDPEKAIEEAKKLKAKDNEE
jgi:bifunctional DNA-binding transcriptional regulator/antitoxin component of YhaV-PrlF toxin-antitoxin module